MSVFIPTNTSFALVDDVPVNASANMITEHLGYNKDEIYTFWDNESKNLTISFIGLEIFSRNIAYVVMKDNILEINKEALFYFLEKLDDDEIYESYRVESKLKEGIENKSFTVEFLAKSLELDNISQTGIFYADKIEMYLFFTNGMLSDYKVSDGLDIWAKRWKQIRPDLLKQYQATASRYWGDNHKAVLSEINRQADAWANTPGALGNEYINMHRGYLNTINFEMLLVCHYDKKISLGEFLIVNHGRHKKLPNKAGDVSIYKVGMFTYSFDALGNLTNIAIR